MHALAWQLPVALNGLFDSSGRRADWAAALEDALNATRALGDRRREQHMLRLLAGGPTSRQRPEAGIEWGQQALAIAQQEFDLIDEAHALIELGWAFHRAKQFADAERCFRRTREIYREEGNSWLIANTLNGLGSTCLELGRLEEALDCHQQALEIFRQVRDRPREGSTLRLLGDVHLAANRLDLAFDCHTRALDIASQDTYRVVEAAALECLGTDLHRTGDHIGAREHWQRALEIYEQLGDPHADDLRTRLHA